MHYRVGNYTKGSQDHNRCQGNLPKAVCICSKGHYYEAGN